MDRELLAMVYAIQQRLTLSEVALEIRERYLERYFE
jgi:hypothetical protein